MHSIPNGGKKPGFLKGQPVSELRLQLGAIAQGAVGVVILFACLGLAGWAFNIAPLKSVLLGLPPMVPVTAVAFLLAGVSLWRMRSKTAGPVAQRIAKACAWMVAIIGAVTV